MARRWFDSTTAGSSKTRAYHAPAYLLQPAGALLSRFRRHTSKSVQSHRPEREKVNEAENIREKQFQEYRQRVKAYVESLVPHTTTYDVELEGIGLVRVHHTTLKRPQPKPLN